MRFESAVAGYETPGPNIRGLSVAMEAGCRVQLVVARKLEFGFLASRCRGALVPLCQQVLSTGSPATPHPASTHSDTQSQPAPLWTCPRCGGPMIVIERLSAVQISAVQIQLRSPPEVSVP